MIVSTPGTCGGRPRIDGTRLTVETIVGKLKAGYPVRELLEDYPYISRSDIAECLNYKDKDD